MRIHAAKALTSVPFSLPSLHTTMAHVALAAAAVAVSYVDARYSILEDLQRGYWYNTAKGE